MSKILIFAEQRGGKLHPAVSQLITVARHIDEQAEMHVCLIGHGLTETAQALQTSGVESILTADDAELERYRPQPYCKMLSAAIERVRPDILLLLSSFMGRDLAPRAAIRNAAALATDCTDARLDGDAVIAIRPVYTGKATAEVKLRGDGLKILSIRPNTFAAAQPGEGGAPIEALPVQLGPEELKLINDEWVSTTSGIKDVTEADIVVSGGRSLKSEENFKILYQLAEVLDAAVGASRAACDAGYQPHSRQVGLTGKTVTPKLYLAFGIDGAIQHLAGMRGSKCIVAINTKKEAPIFSVADYGCVADLFEMAPLLTEEFKKALN